jgi:prepilin-type N-terminal cleavage/methylation domain-containing protein
MRRSNSQAGFSLLEVIIAMGITVTILTLATTLLAAGFRVRAREDRKSDAIADVQRALNIMTRENRNAGLKLPDGLPAISKNGVVTNDSDNESLRIVSNLNGMPDSANGYFEDSDVDDMDEDLKFLMYVDTRSASATSCVTKEMREPNDRAREPHRFADLSLLRRESHLRHDHPHGRRQFDL